MKHKYKILVRQNKLGEIFYLPYKRNFIFWASLSYKDPKYCERYEEVWLESKEIAMIYINIDIEEDKRNSTEIIDIIYI